jgi:hypothetical protein
MSNANIFELFSFFFKYPRLSSLNYRKAMHLQAEENSQLVFMKTDI